MNKIRLEALHADRLDEQIAVGAAVYSTPEVVDRDHICWKHLANPGGVSTSISARNPQGELVGRSFLQPRRVSLDIADSCTGATVTDLVVKPEERNAATMISMTRAVRAPEGFDVVFHTSNEVSDVFYRNLFKFPVVFSLQAAGLPVGVAGAIKRFVSNRTLISFGNLLASPWRLFIRSAAGIAKLGTKLAFSGEPQKVERNEVFRRFRTYAGPHLVRDDAFIDWRFSKGTLFRGDVKWLWKKQECLGYLAFKRVELAGLKIMVIMDSVLSRPLTSGESVHLKLMAACVAADAGCDAVFTLANLQNPALKWMAGFPFAAIPERFLPHPTPIFVHAAEGKRSAVARADLFFSLADLDYF
ncbi:hypothetical protein [uncultured Variovorax sp.]|uniref:hypothetical protein n=1 Tax=uncultured Variovorax sp. TaxID=114708 RepID=UPI0025EBF831|nr:hypothetical protein [uncultured Variovorax sp.]